MTVSSHKIFLFFTISFFISYLSLGLVGTLAMAFDYSYIKYLDYFRKVLYFFSPLVFIMWSTKYRKLSYFIYIYYFFIAYMIIYLLFNLDIMGRIAGMGNSISAFYFNYPIILKSFSFILLGIYLPFIINYKKLIIFLYFLTSCFILSNISLESLALNFMGFVDSGNRSLTLYVSDSYLILSFLVFISMEKKWKNIIFLLISSSILFFLGSRTTLYLLLAFAPLFLIKDLNILKVFLAYFFVALLFIFSIFYFLERIQDNHNVSRMLAIVNLGEDPSYLGRAKIANMAFDEIKNNWFVGSYGGQVYVSSDEHGARWGGYIHDFRSYWRQFGIIGFSIVLLIMVSILHLIYESFKSVNQVKTNQVYFFISSLLLLELLFSRGYTYPHISILVGLLLGKKLEIHYRKRKINVRSDISNYNNKK